MINLLQQTWTSSIAKHEKIIHQKSSILISTYTFGLEAFGTFQYLGDMYLIILLKFFWTQVRTYLWSWVMSFSLPNTKGKSRIFDIKFVPM